VAAGIVNYDSTHVYALDAATGQIRWQNNASGHLDPASLSGVSVQGHLLVHDGKLWLPGGNAVSPAIYDLATGRCLNDVGLVHRTVNNRVPASESPRGSELYLIGNRVMVGGQPFYAHPKYKVYDASVLDKTLLTSAGDRDLAWVNNAKVLCFGRVDQDREQKYAAGWGKLRVPGLTPLWEADCRESVAFALGRNAAVIATGSEVAALDLGDGRRLWTHRLPAAPVPWGLALDRQGRVVVTLENGQVLGFGATKLAAAR
jgi:outer membrane protein assembly factor BamB